MINRQNVLKRLGMFQAIKPNNHAFISFPDDHGTDVGSVFNPCVHQWCPCYSGCHGSWCLNKIQQLFRKSFTPKKRNI